MAEKKTRSNGRETMEKILVHARHELDAVGPVKFNILRVIEKSGVSRSSVYHHFGGRDGVITAVEVRRLSEENSFINLVLKQFIDSASTREAALEGIRSALLAVGTEAGRKQRSHRVAVIAAAQSIPVLAEQMREDQLKVIEELRDIFRTAADRGIISASANLDGVGLLISSLFIGRSVVDLLGSSEADAAWVDATMESLSHLLPPGD